jgi:hypothetical protein
MSAGAIAIPTATWTSLSDDIALNQGDQIRVNINLDCSLFAPLSQSDISAALQQQQAIASVLSVYSTAPWYDPSPLASTIAALINPQQGVSAGDVRAAAMTALSTVNSQKLIPCSGYNIGLIERAAPGSIFQPTPTQTISLVAIAVIAIVVVFLIIQLREVA